MKLMGKNLKGDRKHLNKQFLHTMHGQRTIGELLDDIVMESTSLLTHHHLYHEFQKTWQYK